MNELEREMAKVTASAIRLRLKVARDERWTRWVVLVTTVGVGAAFLYRGDLGFACLMLYLAVNYVWIAPKMDASGMRRGWGMAWITALRMLHETEDVSEIRRQALFSSRLPINERIELDQARMMLRDIEEMLRHDEDR